MQNSTCKLCGAKISFVRTAGGKHLPVDPQQVAYYKGLYNKNRVVTPNGDIVACELDGPTSQAIGIGFIPHWATCTGKIEKVRKKTPEQTLF